MKGHNVDLQVPLNRSILLRDAQIIIYSNLN